jgi:beta-phosphoglucomutase-like phosphatase (HAD superfamily)
MKHALSLVGLYDRFHPHIFSAVEVARGKPPRPVPPRGGPDGNRAGALRRRRDSVPGVIASVAAGMSVIGFVGASHCRPDEATRASRRAAPPRSSTTWGNCCRRSRDDRAAGSDSHAAVLSL